MSNSYKLLKSVEILIRKQKFFIHSIYGKSKRKIYNVYMKAPSFYYRKILNKELIEHTVQVTSWGGAGTTMLINFLRNTVFVNIPPDDSYYQKRFKHMRMPPGFGINSNLVVRKNFRAVYLLSNPFNAIISLFDRERHPRRFWKHYKNMLYPHTVKELDRKLTLETYLDYGQDIYLMEEHFRNWRKSPKEDRDYPIIIVKYETMWNNLEALFKFLKIPLKMTKVFPKYSKRHSNYKNQPPSIRKKLNDIYGKAYETYKSCPEIEIV